MSQSKVARTYIHDTESLLWVLIWVVAHHSTRKDRWEVNSAAAEMIQRLSTHDLKSLWRDKKAMLSDFRQLISDIRKMETDLSKDLAPVIGELAMFFYIYLHAAPLNLGPSASGPDFGLGPVDPYEALHKDYIVESRSQTFDRLFMMVNRHIAWLNKAGAE
ncbi:hypothetical protein FS749_000308 [Ceratobasidium sp. UAMH 11750]|nr:hypothetical protein FS749_000305 [Ceratobasidium sp. UAMH 11750]KAG9090767.1 hypothetical protein FS749_000308 [Ceratobasidium sp. UAMH 11750]